MNVFHQIKETLFHAIELLKKEEKIEQDLDLSRVCVDPPRDSAHGDGASNAAMMLSRAFKMSPLDLAEKLKPILLKQKDIVSVDIAGPGFINICLSHDFWTRSLKAILSQGQEYGQGTFGGGERVNVEYVSANPTGPLHVGHCRGAVVGDVLVRLLQKGGYHVTKEYYMNDAGGQIETLAHSLYFRYQGLFHECDGDIPEGLYPGEYLIDVAQKLKQRDGNRWLSAQQEYWKPVLADFAVKEMMKLIVDDLAQLGVNHDVYVSEKRLVEQGKVSQSYEKLKQAGHVYQGVLQPPKGQEDPTWQPREQTLFRSSYFGDDQDRALKKVQGQWTYFASDIGYHLDKIDRGYAHMINIWGADHGGYVKRLQSAVKALTNHQAILDIKLCQLVKLMDRGQEVKMSKRSGQFITLRQVIDRVGKDVVRFMMLTRRNDAPLVFDFEKVQEKSRDNPVFYVQYAYARISSVFRQVCETFPNISWDESFLSQADMSLLDQSHELALMKRMSQWPRVIEQSCHVHEPHRVAIYLQDLASDFHFLWTKGRESDLLRFIQQDNIPLTQARLALLKGMSFVLESGFHVLGITLVEEM